MLEFMSGLLQLILFHIAFYPSLAPTSIGFELAFTFFMIKEIGLYILGLGVLFYLITRRGELLLLPVIIMSSYYSKLRLWFGDSFGLLSGEALLLELNELLYQERGLSRESEIALPQYKFYTTLVKSILRGMREFGGDGREVLSGLKETIAADLRSDRVLSELFCSALVQFISIAGVTWGFALLAGHLTALQVSNLTLLTVVLLQSGGMALFGFLFFRLRTQYFSPYSHCASVLCGLRSLAKAGLSVQRTLERIDLSNIVANRELAPIKKRLERLIYSYSVLGAPISKELDYLIDDLWFALKQGQLRFKKRVAGIKFLVAALCFFSAYLLYLLMLFTQFLN